ncbi:MAG: transposase [Patescibacteria group bacterium]
MNNWALGFAIKQPCILASWQTREEKPKITEFSVIDENGRLLDFEDIKVKDTPLTELWQPGDRLIAEVGGQSYAFCLQALSRGLRVFRFHSYELSWLAREFGDDEVDKSRKERVKVMARSAEVNSGLLYEMLPMDESVAYITGWIDEYIEIQQEQRIRAQQRANVRLMNTLWMPNKPKGKHIERVKKGFTNAEIDYFLAREADLLSAISKELPNVPIWAQYLKNLNGVGPSIAARLIGEIRDIKRFPKLGGFRSECGLRVVDGKAAKFRRGKEENGKRVTFNPALRQALFLFSDQIVRGGEKNLYNASYKKWKEHYTARDGDNLTKKHIDNRARRAAVSDFADDLWKAWWRLEEARGETLPQSVRDVLYAVNTLS